MNRNLVLAFVCLGLIAVITLASGSNIGYDVSGKPVESISASEVFGNFSGRVPVYTYTITNYYIPRQFEVPDMQGCFFDEASGSFEFASIVASRNENEFLPDDTVELGIGTKEVSLYLEKFPRVPKMEQRDFDYLVLTDIDCWELTPSDEFTKIPIV